MSSLPSSHVVPRGPLAQAVALAPHAYTTPELVALTAHEDPSIARLALEALLVQFSLRAASVRAGGAPTHTRAVEGGVVHTLGPAPEVDHA